MESNPPILFNRARLRKRRARSAANFTKADFLHREAALGMAESLAFIARPFPIMVELGCHTGQLIRQLADRSGTVQYITCDMTEAVHPTLCADEEALPFAEASVDALLSCLALHWVNDLPGTLAQIHRMLKPDGLFMAVLPGGETLRELRQVFAETETALYGGITPRVAPFLDVRDAGALLQRAGFALPVADSDTLTVTYPHLYALMEELRNAAQTSMLQHAAQHFTSRRFFLEAAKRYAERYRNAAGEMIVTVELITLTGWKPAVTQQQPAKRGSGKISLGHALH